MSDHHDGPLVVWWGGEDWHPGCPMCMARLRDIANELYPDAGPYRRPMRVPSHLRPWT